MSKEEFFRTRYFKGLPEDRQSLMMNMIKNASEIEVSKGKFNTLCKVILRRGSKFICL